MVTISGRVTLPTGAWIPVTGSPAFTSTLIGSDAPVNLTRLPGTAYYRVFNGPGKGLSVALGGLPAGVKPHVSFKDPPAAAFVKPFLDALTRPIWLTYNHEPEGDMAVADYKARWVTLGAIVNAHPKHGLVTLCEVYTGYAQRYRTKTGPDGKPTTWDTMWSGVATAIGMDFEVDKQWTGYPTYPDPAKFFAPLVNAGKTLGVPILIPELGWPQIPSDTTGAGLAAWYTTVVKYLRSVGCAAVAAYDSIGSTGNYVLAGPALAAWKIASASQ